MTNSQRLDRIRQHLAAIIRDDLKNSASDEPRLDEDAIGRETDILRESILIRDEFFCGRRFQTANYNAVWFIEQNELKVFKSKSLLTVLSANQIDALPKLGGIDDTPPVATGDVAEVENSESQMIIRMPQSSDTKSQESGETVRRAA